MHSPGPTPHALHRTFSATISPEEGGRELLPVCRQRWPSYALSDWQQAFEGRQLLLNGTPATRTTCVRDGDVLECRIPLEPEPETRTDYRIVYRDESLAVIDKPGNLPSHPAGRYCANTLERLLVDREGWPEVHLVNRLDRETSGLVLIALSAEAASRLGASFMRREVLKTYQALVEGCFPEEPRDITGWLYLVRGVTVRRKRVFVPVNMPHPENAQPVETRFRRIACVNGLSWVEACPVTGRPHQIRATLKAIGHPIVGDKLYGVDETIYARLATDGMTALDRRRLRLPRQALHASRLGFRHPFTKAMLIFTAPLPCDLDLPPETLREEA